MTTAEALLIHDADFPPGVEIPKPAPTVDLAAEIQNKVAPRVAEARLLTVTDQATLDLAGDRLAINKALQKEAVSVFKPIKQKIDASKREVLEQEQRVMTPLLQEETILKAISLGFIEAQRKLQEARDRQEREARESEERRLLAVAEAEQRRLQSLANEQMEREHAEEVERAIIEAEVFGDSPAEIEALCNIPAPAPVVIPLEIPVLAVAPKAEPMFTMPKGMSSARRYKAEVTSITLLCKAVAEGKVPAAYVAADMAKLNSRARADGAAMAIPGVRAVEDSSLSQRTR